MTNVSMLVFPMQYSISYIEFDCPPGHISWYNQSVSSDNDQQNNLTLTNQPNITCTQNLDTSFNLFEHCLPQLQNSTCNYIFFAIISAQFCTFMVGAVLNSIIITSFLRKPLLHKKNASILLFNQAVADLVNLVVYVLPNTIYLLIVVIKKKPNIFTKLSIALSVLTVSSSISLHGIISIERLLALFTPLWHRSYLLKRYLWRAVGGVWSLALLLTSVDIFIILYYVDRTGNWKKSRKFNFAMCILLGSSMIIVIVIFLLNFTKAFISIRFISNQSRSDQVQAKKQFRLTMIFLTMFVFFFLTFGPIMYTMTRKKCKKHHSVCMQTFICAFTLSSVFNPLLTLCLQKKFRC